MKLLNLIRSSLIILFLVAGTTSIIKAQIPTIKNDTFWNTSDGKPIYSQGGGVFRFADPLTGFIKYYWYGVHYKEAEAYQANPAITQTKNTFESVTCYSSIDAVNWTFEADVLTKEEVLNHSGGRPTWVGRLGVAYIKEINKYALVVQHGNGVLFCVADKPTGPFAWQQQISMQAMIGTPNTGDQTVFTDDDGKSYLIYSYGKGRNRIYVSEIGVKDSMVNLLDCKEVYKGESREGNCLFKYKGKYYMCASNIYGWDASLAYYLVANDIRGPYIPTNDMQVIPGCADDYAHITQTGFFFNIKGSQQETVVYCGDRWADFAGNGLGYNQWFPLSFTGDKPYFNSLSSWQLNAKTGAWQVASDNNWVKNGSFEADRRDVPIHVKPDQTFLTGWQTEVLQGNAISLDSTTSPVINYNNTEADRKQVIGEKSLQMSDKVAFQRKVSQVISSTSFVQLTDGYYNLTAKVKNSAGFERLEMYAESKGKVSREIIKPENTEWATIELKHVAVKGGKVEIGFLANGTANAFCYVDDVTLVKAQ